MRSRVLALFLSLVAVAGAAGWLDRLDRADPPPLELIEETGVELTDREGRLLRAFSIADGRWRLAVNLGEVDPQFIDMLIAYEDQRFFSHSGIDLLALGRAAWQMASAGRIVSGGSTLTMQLARLIEPRESRSFSAKLRQIWRALQIERRLSKEEILTAYLTLAPYGGNVEGIRAASLTWFGKEPRKLQLEEAALLVALPQLPERRRPDRYPVEAGQARDRVLKRMARAGRIPTSEIERASLRTVPTTRRQMPALAAHLAETARHAAPLKRQHRTTLDRRIQAQMETVAQEAARSRGAEISLALIVADALTGEILAQVGSADPLDDRRLGWIDMTRQPRSPGSALKPFIFALAFQEGIAAPQTLIADRPANFSGYRPRNFDLAYQGDVPVSTALQMSLNVPALQLLEAVGPLRLDGLVRRAGAKLALPAGEAPGLAIGLGGAGITLMDLVQLYTAFPNQGRVARLGNGIEGMPSPGPRILDAISAWQVADILAGTPRPLSGSSRRIAYKTGTSYGYRDAWAVGFDGRYVIGVWAGVADNRSIPGLTGITAAAPALFDAFARSRLPVVSPLPPPEGAAPLRAEELPVGLRRFVSRTQGLVEVTATEPPPEIVYPPQGSRIDLGIRGQGRAAPLIVKLQGGQAPFRMLANGRPLAGNLRRRTASWLPDSVGFSTLTIIDARGQAASVTVYVD